MALFSLLMVLGSIVLLFKPGPRLGTDFLGGTEVEVAFEKPTGAGDIRSAVRGSGFAQPDVIKVEDANNPHRFLIRVQDVTTIDTAQQQRIEKALCYGDNLPAAQCPQERLATEVKFSPGGDKITVRFGATPDLGWLRERMNGVSGVQLRTGENNPSVQNERAHKVEIQLMSKGDQLMNVLRQELGNERVPANPLRVEWIGPKAGRLLRDAAIKSIAIALVFIMMYVAFRFDLRFAPGGVLALAHDALVTVGVLTALQKELNLTTVAAVLTIIGYSVNDTVVVYDRVRENLGKLRGSSFIHLINVSLSEMLSRTVLTSTTTIVSLVCFFVWGTGTLKDFAFTLIIGLVLGTYSSIYIALPLTEWFDRRFFAKMSDKKKKKGKRRQTAEQAA
jgi:preprotein translocase subunit SecF